MEKAQYSLITNYSILSPEITKPYIVSGDDRFERADELLKHCNDSFSVAEAFQILKSVKQEGIWATRVSFVYSVNENRVYYVRIMTLSMLQNINFVIVIKELMNL